MIISKNFTDSKRNYIKIINDIFKSKRVANEFNLSEKNIKALNNSWHTGARMSILLDPINMNLFITDKDLREFSKVNNEYIFLGKTILLGNINLNNYRKNNLFEKHISPTGTSDLTLNKIKEFLESNNFKRKVLKMTDTLLKEKLICTENEYISNLYNLELLFSEATTSQKLYTHYIESKHRGKKDHINMNSLKIDNDLELLLNARTEILNLILNQNKPSELNGFKFLLWFNKTFYNIPTDNVADIFKLTNIILKNEVENPRINNEEILSSFRIALESVSGQNSDILKYTNLSKNDKKSFMTLLKPAELKTQLQTQKISSEQIINFLKEDFIFDYRLYRELAWKFQDGYSAFYINNLVNINKNSQLMNSVNLIKVSENVTDLYLNKKEFEQFNILLSVLNLELTEYIPETTTIHFIEDDTTVLDRFI